MHEGLDNKMALASRQGLELELGTWQSTRDKQHVIVLFFDGQSGIKGLHGR